jgi:peptide/nickel transport system permease protein
MFVYIVKRIGLMIPTVLLISLVVFIVIQLPPGDFVSSYIARMLKSGEVVDKEIIAGLREAYGLDQSFFGQYYKWISGIVLRADFGYSFTYLKPVITVIKLRMGITLLISIISLLFTYVVSIPIGIYSAVHQYTVGDYVFTVIGFLGMATPNFLLAIIMMYLSYLWTGNPLLGLLNDDMIINGITFANFGELLRRMVIPVVVIGTSSTCGVIRVVRAQMLDELGRKYTLTARAKGLSEGRITYKYCVRAALNPTVSSLAWILSGIFTGSTIAAIVLNLPMQGPILLEALLSQDMYLAGGFLLIMALLVVSGMLLSDLMLAWLDPRIRFTKGARI